MLKTGLSEPGVKKNLKQLKDKIIIARIGSKKQDIGKSLSDLNEGD